MIACEGRSILDFRWDCKAGMQPDCSGGGGGGEEEELVQVVASLMRLIICAEVSETSACSLKLQAMKARDEPKC